MSNINREKFASLLYNTKYDSYTKQEDVKKILHPLRDWIKSNIPDKLYRFRNFNENNIKSLINDEIWGSAIRTFNDPYECMPCYNIDKINKYIDQEFLPEIVKTNLMRLISNDIPECLQSAYSVDFINAIQENADKIQNLDLTSQLRYTRNALVNLWNDNIEFFNVEFYKNMYLYENMYHIACFSETNRSTLMWSHYADAHTGFCLEYDFKTGISDCSESCKSVLSCPGVMLNYPIAPITYKDTRYDASGGFASMLMNWTIGNNNIPMNNISYDMFLTTKTMLTKSSCWEYEKEWRLFSRIPETNLKPHGVITTMKPRAIYLGARMKEHNKKRIINICKEREIPCFQMVPQYHINDYELEVYPII